MNEAYIIRFAMLIRNSSSSDKKYQGFHTLCRYFNKAFRKTKKDMKTTWHVDHWYICCRHHFSRTPKHLVVGVTLRQEILEMWRQCLRRKKTAECIRCLDHVGGVAGFEINLRIYQYLVCLYVFFGWYVINYSLLVFHKCVNHES